MIVKLLNHNRAGLYKPAQRKGISMTINVRQTTELFTTVPNEPGVLASLIRPLQEHGINIEAVYTREKDPSTTALYFVTSDNVRAKEWLIKDGYTVMENNVVCWNTTNTPGMLFKASAALAEKKINIAYTYGSAGVGNSFGLIVFNTSNNKDTVSILNRI